MLIKDWIVLNKRSPFPAAMTGLNVVAREQSPKEDFLEMVGWMTVKDVGM